MVSDYGFGGDGKGKGDYDKVPFASVTTLHPMPNPLDKFVEPGESPQKLLMRTYLEDAKAANIACLALEFIEEFGMSRVFTQAVINWLASRRSIQGLSCNQLLQGYTGVVSEKMNTGAGFGIGRFFGRRGNNNGNGNQNQPTG